MSINYHLSIPTSSDIDVASLSAQARQRLPEVLDIWKPDTGIELLGDEPADLARSDIPGIRAVWAQQRDQLKGTTLLRQFTDRMSREWAIETGIIENLYDIDRGVTQTLIEHGFQSELLGHGSTNKPKEFVIQLLKDQKDALDGVFDFVRSNRRLSNSYIKELHAALLRSQDTTEGVDELGRPTHLPLIKGDWKRLPNYPVRDEVQYKYCPPEQVASEMDRLISMYEGYLASQTPTEVVAAWLHHRFTQIHPFQDGNGRVARAIASLVLVKDGLFPLVVTREDKPSYLNSLEQADRGDIRALIQLFSKLQVAQFRKASAISEAVLAEEDVNALIGSFQDTAGQIAADAQAKLKKVFTLSKGLESDLEKRLNVIRPELLTGLRKISPEASVTVSRSKSETDHYYRSQIIQIAKSHLHYFADSSEYRAWVALSMRWTRRAQLIFSFHGIGRPFNGSLICSPFLEIKDRDEDDQVRMEVIPVTDEGFIFFYNESEDRLLSRFKSWRETSLKLAIREMMKNL